jgi:CxxC motif-containing protein (DUF1111 family)
VRLNAHLEGEQDMKFVITRHARVYLTIALAAGVSVGQQDPGPRSGPAAAGGYYPTLNANEQTIFSQAATVFQEVDSVTGSIAGETGNGLGPTFNGNSCSMCHSQPAIGGSGPGLKSPQNPVPNPQVALATLDGAGNTVPAFITADGPVREARFVLNGTQPDGGVHGLFTIAGRTDASGCTLSQPDFATALATHNVIFRIPTPVFGLGLVENTPDSVLQANLAANQSQTNAMGISGRFNTSGNDGTITRFGWKAQNKSLMIFAGEAYNVEIGVSNEVFPNERSAVPGCVFNPTPEDYTNFISGNASTVSSDVVNFALFMRLSAPATPTTATDSEQSGQNLFQSVGCALCHSTSLTAAASPYTGMSIVTYHPYSDFALHAMGANLADGISQGTAAGDEFRTAPLWGLGQRLFFLHDGRTSDLLEAIQAHFSGGIGCPSGSRGPFGNSGPLPGGESCASEANAVIQNFNGLTSTQRQNILDFLRSL